MSERADKVKPSSVKLTIVGVMVKSCLGECSFAVGVGEKFVVKPKKGEDRGPALELTDAMAVLDVLFFCPIKSK